jgi:DNA-binding MarR family transcriptional regulator
MNPFEVDETDNLALATALPALMILGGDIAERSGELLIFGKFGLSFPQFSVLARLVGHPEPPTMTELKESIFLLRSASRITGIIDDLENRGLVRRVPSPTDRRVHLIEITESGHTLMGQLDQHYHNVMKKFCEDYTIGELQTSIEVLRRFTMAGAQILGLSSYCPVAHVPREANGKN